MTDATVIAPPAPNAPPAPEALTNPSPLAFYRELKWLDGRPLLDTMEPYRQRTHEQALYTLREDGTPLYNLVLIGRGKKNNKSTDLILASFYRLLIWRSAFGDNEVLIAANDEDQANDDLGLAKKLVEVNPDLAAELVVMNKELRRKDGRGFMRILPANDVTGQHGKTALMVGIDELHGHRTHDLLEALAPDPTRPDTLTWITSYDSIYNTAGAPLYDLKRLGIRGEDPRMFFQWYSGDLCTDPDFADLPPEERANPSMCSWPEGAGYLEQQRRRLPTHKFRRLHLNLPLGANNAFFDADALLACIVRGLKAIPPKREHGYFGFVDMSGGSSDDACLAIAHFEAGRRVLDIVVKQDGTPPFNPRKAVRKFAKTLKEYGLDSVTGDKYAGETFRVDFAGEGIRYVPTDQTKTDIYEATEPLVNAGEVEFLDVPKLQEQLLTLVVRGARIDHQPGDHDDFANAACGALALMPARVRKGRRDRRPVIVEGVANYNALRW